MEHSIKKISIIGLGLIGGSIGLAINRYDKSFASFKNLKEKLLLM